MQSYRIYCTQNKKSPFCGCRRSRGETDQKIYELADVYHSDNIDRVSDNFIKESGLQNGGFDNVALAKYSVPSHWDIGKIYKRLILGISETENTNVCEDLFKAYHSFVTLKIEDYNSSFYYESPQYILDAYLNNSLE